VNYTDLTVLFFSFVMVSIVVVEIVVVLKCTTCFVVVFLCCRLKISNILGKFVHEYASGGTLAKLELEQPIVTKLEIKKLSSLDDLQVLVNDNDVTLPNGDTVLNGVALLCGDRLISNNAGTVDHLLDEEGVYDLKYLIDGGRFVTVDACATLEDAGVTMLFLQDASAKKRRANTSSFSMEVLVASSSANEEVDVHEMRVPATNLSKDTPQFNKGKLT